MKRNNEPSQLFFPPIPSNLLHSTSLPYKNTNRSRNSFQRSNFQAHSPYLGSPTQFDIGLNLPQVVSSKNGIFANSYVYSQTPKSCTHRLNPTQQLQEQLNYHHSSLFKSKSPTMEQSSIKDAIVELQGSKPGRFFDSREYIKNLTMDLQEQIISNKKKKPVKKKKQVESESEEESSESQDDSQLTDRIAKLDKSQRKEFMKQKLIAGLMREKAIKKKLELYYLNKLQLKQSDWRDEIKRIQIEESIRESHDVKALQKEEEEIKVQKEEKKKYREKKLRRKRMKETKQIIVTPTLRKMRKFF